MKWQPIETAPKDGTDILVTGKYRHVVVTWANGRWANIWTFDSGDVGATHWMPLPEPPQESEQAGTTTASG